MATIRQLTKYVDGQDSTMVGLNELTFPSKNFLIYKGKAVKRGGISLLGDKPSSGDNNPILSEYVWKDSKSGVMPLRVVRNELQVLYKQYDDEGAVTSEQWITIYSGFGSNTKNVDFTTWVDSNTVITKKRLFMCDGTSELHQWNGFLGTIDHSASDTTNLVLKGDKTMNQLGLDTGNSIIVGGTAYNLSGTTDRDSNTMILSSALPSALTEDTWVVQTMVKEEAIEGFLIDNIYTFQNHVVISSQDSVEMYWSHASDYTISSGALDFVMPASASRTALTPIYFNLDANITALIERKNKLLVSTVDGWFRITKLNEQNAYGLWVEVEKIESATQKGALPHAVINVKGDTVFVAQDKTVQAFSDVEIIETDQLTLISDDVENLFLRLNLEGIRIKYEGRYMYFTVPKENIMLMFDIVENIWQPPQYIAISRVSLFDGKKVGHSNTSEYSFNLFDTQKDLGKDFEGVIAFGYQAYDHGFRPKEATITGFSCRLQEGTKGSATLQWENDGDAGSDKYDFDGSKLTTFNLEDDTSIGTHPFAVRSWGGADWKVEGLKRTFVYCKHLAVRFLESRYIITIPEGYFEFLGMYIDAKKSKDHIREDLFIERN